MELAVVDGDGTLSLVVLAAAFGAFTNGAEGATTGLFGVDDVAVTNGQRLRLRMGYDDPDANTAASGTYHIYVAGPTPAASGDTYITINQSVTEFNPMLPPSSRNRRPRGNIINRNFY